MNTNNIKGFQDFTGESARKRTKIKDIIRRNFELYGFEPAETPIIESEDFVVGDFQNDEAVRDVYRLNDRKKRSLALRYEFTFQLKRIAKNQKLPYKRYQIGYNFRDEPIKKGRSRQFTQCDVDVVGSSIKDEAEILTLGKQIFKDLNIPIKIYINNRKLINEILVTENIKEMDREQIIRELDKLDKLSIKEVADNLKKYNAEKLLKIFTGKEKDFEKYTFYKEIKELKSLCKKYDVKVEFRPFLARGLSYYNGTVFEFWSKELNVSLTGGGSYMIENTQATGYAIGLEPISLLAKIEEENTKVQIISINQEKESIELAKKLRENNISTNLILDKSIKKALEYANTKNIENVIFVGSEEIKKKKFKIKNMKSGKEELLKESMIISLLL